MKALVTARTATESILPKSEFSPMHQQVFNEAQTLCGRAAGICYSTETWEDLGKKPQNSDSRFTGCLKRGHYSIMEHYNVSIVFEGVSKLQAMILNSVQIYSTSERSGRYTPMTGNSDKEVELYQKWLSIFSGLIKENSPDIIAEVAAIRAQENARYVLSVFTHSTNLYYTANLRQWNALLNMLKSMDSYVERNKSRFSDFVYDNLSLDLSDLIYNLELSIGMEGVKDDEVICQNMFVALSDDHIMKEHDYEDDFYGDAYSHTYKASAVQLAQAQRHRAIKYFIHSDFCSDEFYVPEIIKGTNFESEWINDLMSIKHVIPQATLFKVTEVGFVGDFLNKCRHRLCGRAQLEIMQQTLNTLKELKARGEFSPSVLKALNKYFDGDNVKTKCDMGVPCKEPCRNLGVSGAPLKRSI